MKKQILCALLTGAMLFTLSGCTKPDSNSSVATETNTQSKPVNNDKAFTIGFDQDFPPMGFVDENGEFTGFDLDLAKEVAKRLDLEFVAQPIAWDSKDMELSSGTIDCVWNGFTMNGREDQYTWTKPYMENSQVFVVNADYSIAKVEDLTGKIVEVQADSSAEAALKEQTELTSTFDKLQTTPDYNTAFMDLEMGAVNAIAMDVVVARYQIEKRGGGFMILEQAISSESYGVGFKKGNTELRDKVQSALEEMAADGTLKTISEQWFGEDITTVSK